MEKVYVHRRRDSSWAARLCAQAPQGTHANAGLLVQAIPETQRGGRGARSDTVLSYLNNTARSGDGMWGDTVAEKDSQINSRGAQVCACLLLLPIERGATRRGGAHRRSE